MRGRDVEQVSGLATGDIFRASRQQTLAIRSQNRP